MADFAPPGGAGGGGTPGGSNGQIQYNNSGVFGGNSGLSYDGTSILIATASSSSGSARFRVVNDSGTQAQFSVYGSSFPVGSLAGQAAFGSDTGVSVISNGNVSGGGASNISFYAGGYGTVTAAITPTGQLLFGGDTSIQRDAANTLALRNGTNAQTFNIYTTYTDASNYGRIKFNYNGLVYENAGTGPNQDIYIENLSTKGIYFATGAALRWYMNGPGHILANDDNTYDIGASGANRPRNLYLANQLNLTPTWNNGATTFTGLLENVADTASANGSALVDLKVGGVSKFRVAKQASGWYVDPYNGVASAQYMKLANNMYLGTDTAQVYFFDVGFGNPVFAVGNGNGVSVRSDWSYQWSSGSSASGSNDLFLARDAANTMALRNGANAQTMRVYNSYTDASNGSWLEMKWSSGYAFINPNTNGVGTSNGLIFGGGPDSAPAGVYFRPNPSSSGGWFISTSSHFWAATDNAYDIGASGVSRPRNVYVAGYVKVGVVAVSGLPAAATAGAGARMFVTDATVTTFASIVAGSGANGVPVYSDGTNWRIG